MDNIIINPSIQDYINDLLTDNKRSFGAIAHWKNAIKTVKREFDQKITYVKSEKDMAHIYELSNKLVRYYDLIRFENKHIRDNFAKIRGLRNGTIKEI